MFNLCYQQNKLMSRFRKMSHTVKDRYSQAAQFDPISDEASPSLLPPEPAKSAALTPSCNASPIRVGTLVTGIQRADEEGNRLRDALRSRKKIEAKSVHLNLMKLQDKHFKLSGNVYNIAVGEIMDKEYYLNKLNSQINDLKSKIKVLEDEEQSQMSRNIQIGKGYSSVDRSRTIQNRQPFCGRIYSRLNTPKSQRRNGKFRNKKTESSPFYKWQPQIEDDQDLTSNQNQAKYNNYGLSAESERGPKNYRFKQKSVRQPTDRNEEQLYHQGKGDTAPQKSKKTKTDDHQKLKTDSISNQNEANPENEEKIPVQQPYSGIIFEAKPQDSIKTINEDFRTLITNQLQIPPKFSFGAPEMGLTIEEYEKVGREVFSVFGVKVDREPTKMVTRRFKNGVYFQLGGNKNILWYFSGSFYLGGWDTTLPTEGQKVGFGFEFIPNKYIYLGQFKDGMKHGKGSIKMLTNNSVNPDEFMAYEGEWIQGKPHGLGNHIDQKGTKYIGHFVAGQKTGSATILSKEGLLYEGEVKKGLKHGYGVQKLVNGDTYMGSFIDGKFQGQGIYKWKNGSVYQGEFLKGRRHGRGKFTSSNGDQFEGEYKDDLKNGWGKFTWANGQIYEGQFRNDIRHGQGTYKHPSGKIGKFLWKEGQIQERLYSKQEEEYRCRMLKENSQQLAG